jgi:Fe2+ or Zn2+ uptake regulation protein
MNKEQTIELKKKLNVERLTPQRVLLFKLIQQNPGHLHVEELYNLARKKDATINLSTVYRTLHEFKKAGVVHELHLEEEHHHYESGEKAAHHHLICGKCGAVVDFVWDKITAMKKEIAKKYGYSISHVRLQAAGLCQKCRTSK